MSALLSKIQILEQVHYGSSLEQLMKEFHYDFPSSLVKGRNVVAGSARAWGLQFGKLGKSIEADPLYQEAFKLVEGETLLHPIHLQNFFLILKYGIKNKEGDIIEFGSYRCGSAIFIAKVAQALGYTGKVYALDTFSGIPKTDATLDFHLKGDFKKLSFEILTRKIEQLGLTNLILVKGLFEQTLHALLPKMKKVILAHVDCDVEEATRYALSILEKQMDQGGYIAIDDAATPACLGVMHAVEETLQKRGFHAEQAFPHFVYRVPSLYSKVSSM